MKFGQLIEYNMRNIFLESRSQNFVKKLFPDSFLEKQNWAYSWIICLKFYQFLLIVCQGKCYQESLLQKTVI